MALCEKPHRMAARSGVKATLLHSSFKKIKKYMTMKAAGSSVLPPKTCHSGVYMSPGTDLGGQMPMSLKRIQKSYLYGKGEKTENRQMKGREKEKLV